VVTLFFLHLSGVLAAGMLSALGNAEGTRLFYALLAWLAPLALAFQHHVLSRPPRFYERVVFQLALAAAGVLCLPTLFFPTEQLITQPWFATWQLCVRLGCVACFLAGLFLQVAAYRQAQPTMRWRIRICVSGTVCAFFPLIFLSLAPHALGAPLYLPYAASAPWLLICPIIYGYALAQRRLPRADAIFSRATVYALLVLLVLAAYPLVTTLKHAALPTDNVLAHVLIDVVVLLLVVPLYQNVRHLANWIWYASDMSYTSVVHQLSTTLALTLDRPTLVRLLTSELPDALHLTHGLLYVRADETSLALIGAPRHAEQGLPGRILLRGVLAQTLIRQGRPLADRELRELLSPHGLAQEEVELLTEARAARWLPLLSQGALEGLLVLGPREGGDHFSVEDERIFQTIADQSAIAAHNVRLTHQMGEGQRELARLHQYVVRGREQEQRRLARELHDGAVQQVLGLSYRMAHMCKRLNEPHPCDQAWREAIESGLETTRWQLLGVADQLRNLMGELRPSGLDEFGLSVALQNYAAQLRREDPQAPEIVIDIGPKAYTLNEMYAICLFRVAQEGLRNAMRHGKARRVVVSLRWCDAELELWVTDDGRGFQVPDSLSSLSAAGHFGLVGIAERVNGLGGQLSISSWPGACTQMVARLPLRQADAPAAVTPIYLNGGR
jgi:signal transduction histidine kinase